MSNPLSRLPVSPLRKRADGRDPRVLLLAAPRGFCAGVVRAIDAVEAALARFGAPVYVRRPIVHNLAVMRALEAKGAIFVEELDDVPDDGVAILSAHGVARAVALEADRRKLRWFDAVCPLVAKVHREVAQYSLEGRHVLIVGHASHPEIAGSLGQLPPGAATVVSGADAIGALPLPDDLPVAYAVQTTFSVEEARAAIAAILGRFRDVRGPAHRDICYATTNRQAGVRAIAGQVDAFLIAGEHFSSNASRLAEVARDAGCPGVQLVSDAARIDWSLLGDARTIGLSAAASTPETTVAGIVAGLRGRFNLEVREAAHVPEELTFRPLLLDRSPAVQPGA